jgi:hypothetical protein
MCRWLVIWCVLVSGFGGDIATAAVIHDEAIDGDLSDEPSAPTPLRLAPGSNVVRGSTDVATPVEWDAEFFSVALVAPWEVAALQLVDYMQTAQTAADGLPGQLADGGAFLAVEPGDTFDDPDAGSLMIGAALIGVREGRRQGADLLAALGLERDYWEQGFTPPLPSGEYTFWYQQTRGATTYAFDIVVTPIPAAAPLIASAMLALVWLRRRQPRRCLTA